MKKIVQGLTRESEGRKVPVIVFTKNGGLWLEDIAQCGSDCVGLDWTIDIGTARARIGSKVSLQGNMDPSILYASPQSIRAEVDRILRDFGPGNGHVFNLGHGITPDVDPANVAVFVESVHELSQQYHQGNAR
jgi:uroporphyrinogen decarboxylase